MREAHVIAIAEHVAGRLRADLAESADKLGERLAQRLDERLARIEATLDALVGQVQSFGVRLTDVEGRTQPPPPPTPLAAVGGRNDKRRAR